MDVNAGQINSVADFVNVVWVSLTQLVFDVVGFVPELLAAIIIWYVGLYLIDLGVRLLDRVDWKKTKLDNKLLDPIKAFVDMFGRFVLVLIILDFLGIGSSIVAAVAQGFTFAIAIALGIAFGDALKPDAEEVVGSLRKLWKK